MISRRFFERRYAKGSWVDFAFRVSSGGTVD